MDQDLTEILELLMHPSSVIEVVARVAEEVPQGSPRWEQQRKNSLVLENKVTTFVLRDQVKGKALVDEGVKESQNIGPGSMEKRIDVSKGKFVTKLLLTQPQNFPKLLQLEERIAILEASFETLGKQVQKESDSSGNDSMLLQGVVKANISMPARQSLFTKA